MVKAEGQNARGDSLPAIPGPSRTRRKLALRGDLFALATSSLYPHRRDLATFERDLVAAVAAARTAGHNRTLITAGTSSLETELITAFRSSISSSKLGRCLGFQRPDPNVRRFARTRFTRPSGPGSLAEV
jgi:hypothetical protein